MANGPALSTAKGGEIYLGNEIRDSFSLLDVLYTNQFEGETFYPNLCDQTEEHFYRGAPPTWLNFHISEQPKSDDTGTPFIKGEGYSLLVEKICERKKRPGISTVKLFHQPGCGETTLAMQVLWDLKKTLRCAVLTGSTSDITNVAKEVVHLFTAGSRGHQNTVLLLVNNEQILENLKESIMIHTAEQKIVTCMPVVILLSCVRKDAVLQGDVILKRVLSDTEKQTFNKKKEELSRRHSDKYQQFYGFHIMQTNFSLDYIKTACAVFKNIKNIKNIKKAKRPLNTQLAAFLSLLNAYVPGSYLLESQCLDFLKSKDPSHGNLSLEDRMKPFSDLIITFQQDMRSERKVCMVHPMIAQCCTEIMAEAGVTRSDTARNFLTCFCRDDVPPCLHGFIKDMLTKRETKIVENPIDGTEKEEQEKFSRLILDITKEGNRQSALVLERASNTFVKNPFFPQALARFYYIVLKDYNLAEMWAKRAKDRDPQNSFVADTLGQVHKNHLKSKESPAKPREILQLATKAIKAFTEEERLAENELDTDMKEDGTVKVSHIFNTRGQFGYLQVCNLVYDLLVNQNETWRKVLTKNVSMGSVLELLGDNKLFRFHDLINNLRDEVERKCAFFYQYLSYSKLDMKKDDPPYIYRDVSDCYRKYVGDSSPEKFKQKGTDFIQKLKQKLADTSAGVLTCLDRGCTKSDLKEIGQWWEEICQRENSVTALANYIFAHIMLINTGEMSDCNDLTAFRQKIPLSSKDPPELHMLVLLLNWPTDSEDKCVSDLSQLIQCMRSSYENAYKTYLRSRYLQPLFFIGKGQDLNRIVHRKVLEQLFPQQNEETKENWSNEKIFQHSEVQGRLLKVEGLVRHYKVYATIGGKEIEVDANLPNRLWKNQHVSFYLGFTIRGPVAFDIQTKNVEVSNTLTLKPGQTKPERSASRDTTSASGQHFVDRHQTALISKVRDTEHILGKLKKRGVISKEKNDAVAALKSSQDQMEGILQCLTSKGAKDALYKILNGMRSMRPLILELEELE